MKREETVLCLTCGEPLKIKNLPDYCQNHADMRTNLGIPDNLNEALNPHDGNSLGRFQ